ncbi:MAG: DUF805 domain-containing protein [Campylobacterota bacterium]|nr:DUF805 domain-containing protein [Campylobacterota bacterium]
MEYLKDFFKRYYIDTLVRRYAEFSGRASRSEFWYYVLFNMMIITVFSLFMLLIKAEWLILLYLFYAMMIFPATLSLLARRLHDTGRTGWWYLLIFLPALPITIDEYGLMHIPYLIIMILLVLHYVGLLILLYFLTQKSQPGSNRYGPDPHEQISGDNRKNREALKNILGIMTNKNKKD